MISEAFASVVYRGSYTSYLARLVKRQHNFTNPYPISPAIINAWGCNSKKFGAQQCLCPSDLLCILFQVSVVDSWYPHLTLVHYVIELRRG